MLLLHVYIHVYQLLSQTIHSVYCYSRRYNLQPIEYIIHKTTAAIIAAQRLHTQQWLSQIIQTFCSQLL